MYWTAAGASEGADHQRAATQSAKRIPKTRPNGRGRPHKSSRVVLGAKPNEGMCWQLMQLAGIDDPQYAEDVLAQVGWDLERARVFFGVEDDPSDGEHDSPGGEHGMRGGEAAGPARKRQRADGKEDMARGAEREERGHDIVISDSDSEEEQDYTAQEQARERAELGDARARIGSAGVEEVVRLMQRFEGDATLQERGCEGVWRCHVEKVACFRCGLHAMLAHLGRGCL